MRKNRKAVAFAAAAATALTLAFPIALGGCASGDWSKKYDTAMPSLKAEDGWVQTLDDDFARYRSIEEVYDDTAWHPSPHGLRKDEYWCDQMVEFDADAGAVVIRSRRETDHRCEICVDKAGNPVSEGIFTGGIETSLKDGKIFEQAYGYFETCVKVPRGSGMWSAFWLQCAGTSKIGNDGMDGTEIDVYESSFMQKNRTKTGNALHLDAYDAPYYRMADNVSDVGYDLYDGQYHTYGLHWTPEKYVFYVDGKAVWATDFGKVSRVPEILRLTVEIRNKQYGPYGQYIGTFENHDDDTNDFGIKYVKVWQNDAYLAEIKSPDDFKDMKKQWDTRNAILFTLLGVAGAAAIAGIAAAIIKKRNAKQA